MSAYDKLLKEFSTRKFKSEELRFLIEKFKVELPFSVTKKELAKTLTSLLLEKEEVKSPRKKKVVTRRRRGNDRQSSPPQLSSELKAFSEGQNSYYLKDYDYCANTYGNNQILQYQCDNGVLCANGLGSCIQPSQAP